MRTSVRWALGAGIVALIVLGVAPWFVRPDESLSHESRTTRSAPDAAPTTTQSESEPAPARLPTETRSPRERSPEPSAADPPAAGNSMSGTDDRVMSGLRWIAGRQAADGSWGDPAATGLAVLVFLGHGETHQSGVHREALKSAQKSLEAGQDADGCLVPRSSRRMLRDHAIAGLSLTEAYGMTGANALKEPARRALAFALKSRSPGGAWNLPAPDDAEVDVETTAWMTMLLKSGVMCELGTDKAVLVEVPGALDPLTDGETGRLRASPREPSSLSEDATTAVGALVRLWCGRRPDTDVLVAKSLDSLVAHLPAVDTSDLPYVYFASNALLCVGGARLRTWMPAMAAIGSMPSRGEGPEQGSWDPPEGGDENARFRATVHHLLICEFFYGRVGHSPR